LRVRSPLGWRCKQLDIRARIVHRRGSTVCEAGRTGGSGRRRTMSGKLLVRERLVYDFFIEIRLELRVAVRFDLAVDLVPFDIRIPAEWERVFFVDLDPLLDR